MARARRSLKNIDYHDRELLHILDSLGDAEGWTTTEDLIQTIRISHPDGNGNIPEEMRLRHARHCIGSRFSWMVRFGWAERDESRKKWRVTSIGHDLMNGRLTKTLERSLDKAQPADRLLIMRELAGDYKRTNPASTMLRREWEYGTKRS